MIDVAVTDVTVGNVLDRETEMETITKAISTNREMAMDQRDRFDREPVTSVQTALRCHVCLMRNVNIAPVTYEPIGTLGVYHPRKGQYFTWNYRTECGTNE